MVTNNAKHRIGVYPGTFDPITKGHLDIINRAGSLVDHLIIGVAESAGKEPCFTLEERLEMVNADVSALNNINCTIEAQPFGKLLVDFARDVGASVIVRGLRAVSDFEYEFQLFGVNTKLAPDIQTVFLMTSDKYQFLASSLIRETAKLGGDVSPFVSEQVEARLKEKYSGDIAA